MSTPCSTSSWATRVSPWLGRGAGGVVREQSRGLRRPGRPPPSPALPPASAGFSRDYRDDAVEQLLTLRDGLGHPEPSILFHTCHSVAQVPARASVREGGAAPSGPRGPLQHLLSRMGSTGAGPGRARDGSHSESSVSAPPPAPSCACWVPPSLRGPVGRVWVGAQLLAPKG